MLFRTHLAFGFLTALLVKDYFGYSNMFTISFLIFMVFVLFGSLLPDLDNPNSKIGRNLGIISKIFNKIFGHRGITHGIWFPLGLTLLIGYFWNYNYGIAVAIGYLSHVLIDGLTKKGINLLHPFSKLHISGFVETGSFLETIILLFILTAIFFKIVVFV